MNMNVRLDRTMDRGVGQLLLRWGGRSGVVVVCGLRSVKATGELVTLGVISPLFSGTFQLSALSFVT